MSLRYIILPTFEAWGIHLNVDPLYLIPISFVAMLELAHA
jgi:hypothetical protein